MIVAVPAEVVGVDIPLGLTERGWRQADLVTKTRLGRRSSTLFLTPPRAAFAEECHAAASARCRELTSRGFSIQAWGLRPKLLEANTLYDEGGRTLREVHPELSFITMGLPRSAPAKKTWAGHRARLGLLSSVGIDIPGELGAAGLAPPDDVLDAAAAAWTADRIARGVAQSVPHPPQLNERGQQMAIWC
jgi:predicted RNase H-like nuclease